MFDFSVETKTKTDSFDQVDLWDMLIIGAGPAGLNAALYAKRKGLEVGVITDKTGGQLNNTSAVDNYLGFTFIDGEALGNKFLDHVNKLDIPILKKISVQSLLKRENTFEIVISDGRFLKAKTVLIATGAHPRKLNIPGEEMYANKGVTYCATCDAPFFKDKHVIVSGGGNAAAEGVIDLVPWAKKITVVHRSQWRADKILLTKLAEIEKLDIYLETQITKVLGDDTMTGIEVYDKATQETRTIPADGLLIEIGTIPNSHLIKTLVETNAQGEVITNTNQMTSLAGLFAAGDITAQPHKQIIIAAAEGAKAALAANHYINHKFKGE